MPDDVRVQAAVRAPEVRQAVEDGVGWRDLIAIAFRAADRAAADGSVVAPAIAEPEPDRVPVGPNEFIDRKPGESYDEFGRRADAAREARRRQQPEQTDEAREAAMKRATAVWGSG